jgi:hypothetical protein
MDSTIRNKYFELASIIKGEVSPVSIVWKYLRQNYPGIELYDPDESHPSAAGSYAAACCFYSTIFKKDPTSIIFDFSLSATDATIIKNSVKTQVFDFLNLWDYKQPPISDFQYSIGPGLNEVIFYSMTHGTAETYFWDFGDSTTSSSANSTHSYLSDGTFTVSLTTTNCDLQGLHTSITDTVIQFCSHTPTIYTSHPWLCSYDTLWTQAADSYQWYANRIPIPETNQYLPNYHQYNFGNFSVVSTVNGCSELSAGYTEAPVWSGYYFDIWPIGDPCVGDTVPFAVLNANGQLTGLEIIQWFKNDTLLTSVANEDTLFITSGGIYECRVINPNSNCPFDTTAYEIEFECGTVGVDMSEGIQDLFWSIFPNPASQTITIKCTNDITKEHIQIYNSIGCLIKELLPTTSTINISDLANGLYFVRLKDGRLPGLKFIKQ